jgi:ribose transport system ATP-binding protein
MMRTNHTPVLELRDVHKAFGGARALSGASLKVLPGEVHGLVGENGCGKSTLIKILAGYHAPDAGSLHVNGNPVALPLSPGQPRTLGFEFVHQDLGLIPSLSVTENLFLEDIATSKHRFYYSWARATRRAVAVLERYNLALNPDAKVEDVRPVEQAMLAIVRAHHRVNGGEAQGHSVLFLDEPTAFLPLAEVSTLFELIRGIAQEESSVVFVSHKLNEVLEITDRATVLRNGLVAGTVRTKEATTRSLASLILGTEYAAMERLAAERPEVAEGHRVMEVRGLSTSVLSDVGFTARQGEVLGLTGLLGSGYEDIVYALFGAIPDASGIASIHGGTPISLAALTPPAAMKIGIALVPGERRRYGAVLELSAAENVNLLVLDKFVQRTRLALGELKANAVAAMERGDVRPASPSLDFALFSGGNQQKLVMEKWVQTEPRVLLLHEPTVGVDVGARQEIWRGIRASAPDRITLCASADYEQLAALCDRVAVVANGQIIEFLAGSGLTQESLTRVCLRGARPRARLTARPDHDARVPPTVEDGENAH